MLYGKDHIYRCLSECVSWAFLLSYLVWVWFECEGFKTFPGYYFLNGIEISELSSFPPTKPWNIWHSSSAASQEACSCFQGSTNQAAAISAGAPGPEIELLLQWQKLRLLYGLLAEGVRTTKDMLLVAAATWLGIGWGLNKGPWTWVLLVRINSRGQLILAVSECIWRGAIRVELKGKC